MDRFIVSVPEELGDKSLIQFFRGWDWQMSLKHQRVVFDFSKSRHIAPWAITLFALHALWLREERRVDVDVWVDPSTSSGRYLVQSGIFELLGLPRPDGVPEPSEDRTVRLQRIEQSRDVPVFARQVTKILSIGDEELEGATEYSLIELLRNVVQHSGSPVGGLSMAQYYPKTGLVDIVVADHGVGVRSTLRRRYPELSDDLAAVKFALLPHVSGTFGQHEYGAMKDNAGLGLFFIREIASRAGGGFFIVSRQALVDIWGDADGHLKRHYVVAKAGGWQGTFALLQLRRDSIAEFNSLLAVCRDLAAEARKDPSEIELDFVDSVPEIEGLTVVRASEFAEDVEAAAKVREEVILPRLASGELVVIDFSGVRAATQSFAHACMYKVLRERSESRFALSIAGCSDATREAVRAVAAYARVGLSSEHR